MLKAMAASSNTFKCLETGSIIILSLLILSHLVFVLGASETESEADPHRHKRAVEVRVVSAPNVIPENVSSDVTLFNLTSAVPNRNYVVTNNSAGVPALFQVTNGRLTLRSGLPVEQRKLFDYEKFKTFEVTGNATNQTDPTDVVILTIRMTLSDINDEPPVFVNKPKPLYATVATDAPPGTVIFTVTVADADSNPNLVFGIDQATSGDRVVTERFQSKQLDGGTEAQKVYNIITAGSGPFTSGADYTIKITAQDRNTVVGALLVTDNIIVRVGNRPPQFFEQSYKGRIYESTQATSTNWVLEMDSSNKLGIRVLQFQPGNTLSYQLLEQGNRPSQYFDIRAEDNVQRIVNRMPIDYEVTKFFALTIKVTEGSTGLTSTVPITIDIIDENDHYPTFFAPQYTATIREDMAVGMSVLEATASDLDSGLYGEIIFSISNSTSFDVTTRSMNSTFLGTVRVKSPLDFDSDPKPRQFNVIASDKGTPALSTPVQVTVFLQNVNDNPPTIVNTTTTFYLNETTPVGSIVAIIHASDIDGDSVKLYFQGKVAWSEIFTIRESSGQIVLNSSIPRNKDSYLLKVIAVDEDNCCGSIKTGAKTATATFTVNIVGVNINKPNFNECLSYDTTASVKENAPIGTPVIQVRATDPDRGENGVVIYRIETPEANSDRDVFQINSTTGNITVKGTISRETYDFIQLTIVGRNPPSNPLMEGICTFRVSIIDINNNPPTFSQALYTIPLSFSTLPPYIVTRMVATDKDVGANANITYSFGMNDTLALSVFSIDPQTGVIKLVQPLNQSITFYILIVVANDNGKDPYPLTGNTTVNVTISFDRRRPPVWLNDEPDEASYNVTENTPKGYVIATLACQTNSSDTDSKNFDLIRFTDSGVSKMNLSLRNPLDYETQTSYTLSIVCQTLNAEALRAKLLTRIINVVDANDEPPEFVGLDANGRYRGTVSENAQGGETVMSITAGDKDTTVAYKTVTFFLEDKFKDLFQINDLGNNRAEIVTTNGLKLDRENVSQYTLEIVAQDGAPASPPNALNPNLPNTASRYMIVTVADVNDNPPVFPEPLYTFNVSENAPVMSLVGYVTAIDPDEIDQGLDYRFVTNGNTPNAFNIFSITGEIRVAKKLDYENQQEPKKYILTLIAVDSYQLHTATTTVQIYILDENDNRPIFIRNPYRVENAVTEEDKSITRQNPLFLVQVAATDADVDRPQTMRYSLYGSSQSNVNQLFMVDAESGNVSLIGSLDRDIPPYFYTVTIEAKDEIENPLNNFADVLVYPLMTVVAIDRDFGDNGTVNFKVAPDQPEPTLATMFQVSQKGDIYTTGNVTLLDRETLDVSVSEYQSVRRILTIPAKDLDIDPINREMTFNLEGNTSSTKFFTVTTLGTDAAIYVNQAIDYEKDPHVFTFTLRVKGKEPGQENTTQIQVTILDFNDNAPVFNTSPPGRAIANFTATDADEGANAEIEYSIDRATDPRYEYYINATTGVVTTRKRLDREVQELIILRILAIDKGEIPLTGTATLSVTLTDINDNAPSFREKYRPVVISATDPDTREHGPPFGFLVPAGCNVPACNFFTLTVNDEGDGGNRTATITTSTRFDREAMKYYYLPIVMYDMDGKPGSMTATNTFTIIIGDENDNTLEPGHQNIYIYNYEGQFKNTEIGRVYVDDKDDWDLPDKTFTYVSPDNLKDYFSVNEQTGMITMKPDVPPNTANNPYQFRVNVFDKKFEKTVTSTVSVIIQLITDESVRKSGGVRLE
ncbi:unnamed protein product, partial [Candidula unifasciata]